MRLLLACLPLAVIANPVCFPRQLEYDYYDSLTQAAYHGAIDYRLGLLAVVTPSYRLVHDYTHGTDYNTTASGCVMSRADPATTVLMRCLPDNRVKTGETTVGMGLRVEQWWYSVAGQNVSMSLQPIKDDITVGSGYRVYVPVFLSYLADSN